MSRTIALVALAIVAVFISSDRTTQAAAPTTQPDLNALNAIQDVTAMLKQTIARDAIRYNQVANRLRDSENENDKLMIRIIELQKSLIASSQANLNQPYRSTQLISPSSPAPNPDSVLGSFAYNGKTVYLVGPLMAKQLTVQAKVPVNPQPANPVPVER